MPPYIALLRWTQKGIENVKESPSRLDRTKEALKAVGGELRAGQGPRAFVPSQRRNTATSSAHCPSGRKIDCSSR